LGVDGGVGVGFPRSRVHGRIGSLCWNGAADGVGVLLELRMMLEVGSPIGVRACYSWGWCWNGAGVGVGAGVGSGFRSEDDV
jgi:hypothetical protein